MRTSLLALAAASLFAGAVHAAPATYAIDPTHTFATFEIDHNGATTNRARFDKKEGTLTLDREGKTGSVDISIDIASVNSGTPGFDKHLQSKDIFNVAEHPKARFQSTKFVFDGDKLASVEGNMTLLGKTQPVTFKANKFNCYPNKMLQDREVCGGDFDTTFDRTAFGLDYGVNWGAAKNVRLVVQIEAVKQ